MQKVIIPALALLIGMALGALLMKNSLSDGFTWQTGNNLVPRDTEPIKIEDAFSYFKNYINDPIPTKQTVDDNTFCLGKENALYGWTFDYKKFKIIEEYYGDRIDRISLFIGKDPSNDHTIILVPEDAQGNLMVGNEMMVEYVRPCPPRCKKMVHFYDIDPNTRKARYTNRNMEYKKEGNCMENPFTEPK